MKIELYEYGLDARLQEAERELRSGLTAKLSKRDKDVCIAKALGTIETLRLMLTVSDEDDTDTGNE